MSILRKLADELYLDKVLIAVNWIGFVVCSLHLLSIIIQGFYLRGIADGMLNHGLKPSESYSREQVESLVTSLGSNHRSSAIVSPVSSCAVLVFHMFYLRLAGMHVPSDFRIWFN